MTNSVTRAQLNFMRVVSLVPSWTEMLIKCGVEVVGRTRFCIHPEDKVSKIPAVGGTKDLDWGKVDLLSADLLILDQEENLLWMKEQSKIPVFVSHVTGVQSVALDLNRMNQILKNEELIKIERRWLEINKKIDSNPTSVKKLSELPGLISLLHNSSSSNNEKVDLNQFEDLVYVIWKNPWMCISPETFIGSVLSAFGLGPQIKSGFENIRNPSQVKYPEFKLEDFNLDKTFFLFSSEPFPFQQKLAQLEDFKLNEKRLNGAIIDGEKYSWFGIRSLEFLETEYERLNYLGATNWPG